MTERPKTDAFGLFAFFTYIGVGGFLVFAFAWSLQGAVEVQNASVCRALDPQLRGHIVAEVRQADGSTPANLKLAVDGVESPLAAEGGVLQAFPAAGSHHLKFEAEGAAPFELELGVAGSEEVRLEVTLAAPGGQGASTIVSRSPWLAPDLEVQDLEGRPVRLSDFRGRWVVLNFWATWCEPCISEWPQVHKLAERLSDRDDVVVLAVSIDEDRSLITPFLERMSLAQTPTQVLWDPTQSVHRSLGTEKIPDTYFIDGDGQVQYAFVNVRKWGSPEAYHCVDGSVQ